MGDGVPGDAWVFHTGALGDFVLVWPLIRALAHAFGRVNVVADSEKAAVAARWIGRPGEIIPHDIQRRAFTRLWTGQPADAANIATEARLVINAVADPQSPAGAAWEAGARTMFPAARLVSIGAPGSVSRLAAWSEFGVQEWGGVPAQLNPIGPIVCHVGAGSAAKRWPLKLWAELRATVASSGPMGVRFIAGEVEAERFSSGERQDFFSLDGRICDSLTELASVVHTARAFIGADSGPTHLAAQLGITTLALFGPTDPNIWAPIGPAVRVLRPAAPVPMDWLTIDRVMAAVEAATN